VSEGSTSAQSRSKKSAVLLSLDELTEVGLRFAPRSLVGANARASLHGLDCTGAFPRCFSFGALELRLDDDERVDMLVAATTADGGRRAVALSRRRGARPRHSSNISSAQVESAVALWLDDDGRNVEALWLECDRELGTGATQQPPGFAFLRFAPTATSAALLTTARALVPEAEARLARLLALLAPGESVLHLASAPHRQAGGVVPLRIHLGCARGRVLPLLRALSIGEGRCAVAAELLEAWPPHRPIGIQLGLYEDRVDDRIDLELYLDEGPRTDSRWLRALAKIESSVPGIDPEKLDALAAWCDTHAEDGPLWPVRVQRVLQVKVTLTAGKALAKAYLGFTPRLAV
jgi:hypothetical protein